MNRVINSVVNKNAKIYENVRIVNSRIGARCIVAENCDIVDSVMDEASEFGRRNRIRNTCIGIGSYTGTNTTVIKGKIANYSSIGWNVSIGGDDHPISHTSMYTDYWYRKTFGIVLDDTSSESHLITAIGSDVWIGAGAIVLAGISVGDGAVIGAGSVVTNDIPPYGVAVGVPARVIRYRFEKKIVDILMEASWWEWPIDKLAKHIDILRMNMNIDTAKKLLEFKSLYL